MPEIKPSPPRVVLRRLFKREPEAEPAPPPPTGQVRDDDDSDEAPGWHKTSTW
jgi:hypothetical protein